MRQRLNPQLTTLRPLENRRLNDADRNVLLLKPSAGFAEQSSVQCALIRCEAIGNFGPRDDRLGDN